MVPPIALWARGTVTRKTSRRRPGSANRGLRHYKSSGAEVIERRKVPFRRDFEHGATP